MNILNGIERMVGISKIKFHVIIILQFLCITCKQNDIEDIASCFYEQAQSYAMLVQYIDEKYLNDMQYQEAENIAFADCNVKHSAAYSQIYDDNLCSKMKSLGIKEIVASTDFGCPNRRMKIISFLLKDNVRGYSYQIIYDFCPYELKDFESTNIKIKKLTSNYYILRSN